MLGDRFVAPGEALAELGELFVDDGSFGDTLHRVMVLGRRLAEAEMAGLTTVVRGKLRPGASTGACARSFEELQCSHGEGPCVDALRWLRACRFDGSTVLGRWPRFASHASDQSVVSALSLPIVARGAGLGALTLYSRRSGKFDAVTAARLTVFARRAAVVISNARAYWDARRRCENLDQAMRSRATIDYATGILMANGGRTAEEAFQILVRASQRENRKLREIANDIVERAPLRRPPLAEL